MGFSRIIGGGREGRGNKRNEWIGWGKIRVDRIRGNSGIKKIYIESLGTSL